jgi:hypothetical protein
VRRRLEVLRKHRWSSWQIYAGIEPNGGWLQTDVISRACGGRSRAEMKAALKAFTEQPVRHGKMRLAEVVSHTGMKYQTAAQAVKRFSVAMAEDRERKRFVSKLKNQMSNI